MLVFAAVLIAIACGFVGLRSLLEVRSLALQNTHADVAAGATRAEPTMPTMPLALATGLLPDPERTHDAAKLADLGAKGAVHWRICGRDLKRHPLQGTLVEPGLLGGLDRSWQASAFGDAPAGTTKAWSAHGLGMTHFFQFQSAQGALREDGLLADRATPEEKKFGKLGLTSAVATMVGAVLAMVSETAAGRSADSTAGVVLALLTLAALPGFLAHVLTGGDSLRRLTPAGVEKLREVFGVRVLLRETLVGRRTVTSSEAHELFPWAIFFGLGDEWITMLVRDFRPPEWLSSTGRESWQNRLGLFCSQAAKVCEVKPDD